MKILKLILLLCFAIQANAQFENNIWYFGQNAGLDFSSGTPVSVDDGLLSSMEGCASICDGLGNLLFYTNGESIRNKNHNLMLLGADLDGSTNSTQAALILPKPLSDNLYYVFTADAIGGTNGLKWSEVNMNLDGGLGGVTTNKNVLLYSNAFEKLTAIRHENNIDFWVISHEFGTNAFVAFLVTNQGVSMTPVISNVGSVISQSDIDAVGYLKASKDGNRIAAAQWNNTNSVEVFDFDKSTGQLNNTIAIANFDNNSTGPYGIEFSTTGQFLYVGERYIVGKLHQFNLSSGVAEIIRDSKVTLDVSINRYGALQLGPDDKIYVAIQNYDNIGVIHQPDMAGEDCMFEKNEIDLGGNYVTLGLPNFPHYSNKQIEMESENHCYGTSASFSFTTDLVYDSLQWNFGDTTSGLDNFSILSNPEHLFSEPGSYIVSLTIFSNGIATTCKELIYINALDDEILIDRTGCEESPVSMIGYVPNATNYFWSNGDTGPIASFDSSGIYTLEVTIENCGTLTDSVLVNLLPVPYLELGNDTLYCTNFIVTIEPEVTDFNLEYQWSNNAITNTINAFNSNEYSLTVTNSDGCTNSDAVFIDVSFLQLNGNHANLACHDDSSGVALVFPTFGTQPYDYQWNTGDETYTINNLPAGDYTVTVTEQKGCSAIEEFTLTEPEAIQLDIVINDDNISTPNPDGAVFFNPSQGIEPYTFTWDAFGELPNPTFDLPGGEYVVTISDANDCEVVVDISIGGNPVGLDEIVLLESIQIYPNPTSDFLFVKSENGVGEELEFSIINTLGQEVSNFLMEKNNEEFQIDVSYLETGIYFLQIKKEEESRIWKVNVIK